MELSCRLRVPAELLEVRGLSQVQTVLPERNFSPRASSSGVAELRVKHSGWRRTLVHMTLGVEMSKALARHSKFVISQGLGIAR